MLRSALAALGALCLLTACDTTSSLKELRTAAPTGDTYQTALASDYREFAEIKVARYDWWASKYFADKGLMAAYGRQIEPEQPENWDIPATMLPEFSDARAKLMASIEANRSTQPELAASAVVAYDSWVEVQHNGWDVAKIEERRDVFFAILSKLDEAHVDASPPALDNEGNTITPIPPGMVSAPTTPTPVPVESTSTILYFPLDSDHLGQGAQAAIAQLVSYIKTAGNVSIAINGHADRAGTEEYNLNLSERRARFVMEALRQAGVPANLMKYFAFGETDPAVPTADGVKEPRNRRVEIFIE